MYARAFSVATPRELRDFTHESVYVTSIVTEVLRELQRGATPRECALRFQISVDAVRNYSTGRRFGLRTGRPMKLSRPQKRAMRAAYEAGEATIFELASIYRQAPATVLRAVSRVA